MEVIRNGLSSFAQTIGAPEQALRLLISILLGKNKFYNTAIILIYLIYGCNN